MVRVWVVSGVAHERGGSWVLWRWLGTGDPADPPEGPL